MCQRCEFSAKRIHQLLKTTGVGDRKDCFLSVRNICPLLRISVILLFPICRAMEGDITKNVRCCREVLQNPVRMKWEVASNISFRYCRLHCLYPEASTSKWHCYGTGGTERSTGSRKKKTFSKDSLLSAMGRGTHICARGLAVGQNQMGPAKQEPAIRSGVAVRDYSWAGERGWELAHCAAWQICNSVRCLAVSMSNFK